MVLVEWLEVVLTKKETHLHWKLHFGFEACGLNSEGCLFCKKFAHELEDISSISGWKIEYQKQRMKLKNKKNNYVIYILGMWPKRQAGVRHWSIFSVFFLSLKYPLLFGFFSTFNLNLVPSHNKAFSYLAAERFCSRLLSKVR